jgi:hypothetical protein
MAFFWRVSTYQQSHTPFVQKPMPRHWKAHGGLQEVAWQLPLWQVSPLAQSLSEQQPELQTQALPLFVYPGLHCESQTPWAEHVAVAFAAAAHGEHDEDV